MSPGQISKRIAAERLAWIERMLQEVISKVRVPAPAFCRQIFPIHRDQ